MLEFDPARRATVPDVSLHPWMRMHTSLSSPHMQQRHAAAVSCAALVSDDTLLAEQARESTGSEVRDANGGADTGHSQSRKNAAASEQLQRMADAAAQAQHQSP